MHLRTAALALLAAALPANDASPRRPANEPELVAPGILSTGDEELGASWTPDGDTLYFSKGLPDGSRYTIVRSVRRGDGWSAPAVVPFSGRYSDIDPFVSPDGRRIYFASTRPVSGTEPRRDYDLWYVERNAGGWGAPVHIPEPVSSARYSEIGPCVTADGTLYLSTWRADSHGRNDLYRARPRGAGYGELENLGIAVNTAGSESDPDVAADGSLLLFGSSGHQSGAGDEVYLSRAAPEGWTQAVRVDAASSPANDFAPRLSRNGRWLFFTSNRRIEGEETLEVRLRGPGNGLNDLYRLPVAALPPPGPRDEEAARTLRALDALDRFAARRAAADSFSGTIAVSRAGRIVYTRSFGLANRNFAVANTADTRYAVGSVAKMFTGVAVLQLVQQGRLSLDDTVGTFVRDLPARVRREVTIRQLLTHTSGMGNYWTSTFHESNHARYRTVADYLPLFAADTLQFAPGTAWRYSNAGYMTLGAIIERVTGRSFFAHVEEHVFRAAGMDDTGYFETDRVVPRLATPYTRRNRYLPGDSAWVTATFLGPVRGSPAGGAISTAADLLRFTDALRDGRLLDRRHLEMFLAPMVAYDRPELRKRYGFGVAEQ
jgi:CubicO group peptidase (beta-lactamase class C family)